MSSKTEGWELRRALRPAVSGLGLRSPRTKLVQRLSSAAAAELATWSSMELMPR